MNNTQNQLSLVTIYIPTYNRANLLQRAVESVLTQSYQNIELIIVDDRSNDDTERYLIELSQQDSRVKYIVNEINCGACVSRNKAISNAKGEYITGLDDDDYLLSNHISSLMKAYKSAKDDCIAIYPNVYIKTELGVRKLNKSRSCSYQDLICDNFIGNQIFTKTSFLREIRGFDPNLQVWQDLDTWYRLLKFFNSKAYSTGQYSYIVDVSHPHERISNRPIKQILESFEYFCHKHQLTSLEKQILELQLIPYIQSTPKLSSIAKRIIYSRNPRNIKRAIKLTLDLILRK